MNRVAVTSCFGMVLLVAASRAFPADGRTEDSNIVLDDLWEDTPTTRGLPHIWRKAGNAAGFRGRVPKSRVTREGRSARGGGEGRTRGAGQKLLVEGRGAVHNGADGVKGYLSVVCSVAVWVLLDHGQDARATVMGGTPMTVNALRHHRRRAANERTWQQRNPNQLGENPL